MFDLKRLKARTEVKMKLILELLFADDAAVLAESEEDM